jgi:hypothetical protein
MLSRCICHFLEWFKPVNILAGTVDCQAGAEYALDWCSSARGRRQNAHYSRSVRRQDVQWEWYEFASSELYEDGLRD